MYVGSGSDTSLRRSARPILTVANTFTRPKLRILSLFLDRYLFFFNFSRLSTPLTQTRWCLTQIKPHTFRRHTLIRNLFSLQLPWIGKPFPKHIIRFPKSVWIPKTYEFRIIFFWVSPFHIRYFTLSVYECDRAVESELDARSFHRIVGPFF